MEGKAHTMIGVWALAVMLVSSLQPAGADVAQSKTTGPEVACELEWDAYYTAGNVIFSLTDAPIAEVGAMSEREVYRWLLKSSLLPRFVLLEASVYPMSGLGCVIKHNLEQFYDDLKYSRNFNLVKAVTAGFEEPYAVSVFAGNVLAFKKPGARNKAGNKGYMGYLFSFGDYHIKDNVCLYDKWYEVEWKLKGDRIFRDQKLSWSFRLGARFHEHPDISDALYVSLRRSRLDFLAPSSSIWKNSGFEYTFTVNARDFRPMRHYLSVEKKWPLKNMKVAPALSVGFVWESQDRYTGDLARPDEDDFQIILRPNLNF